MAQSSSDCGVLLVAKPAGITSHDVVAQIRRTELAKGVKVGHAGTLDPFATGLLLILIGRATRLARYLVGLPKSYVTVAQFGAVSDTGDRDGEITETGKPVDRGAIEAAMPKLTGKISQSVPMTSAVKVGGERLYRKARRGETIETPVREVEIARFAMTAFDESSGRATLEVDCSSGTYIRQLVADLGELCGSGAYCAELERTAVGRFALTDADSERIVDASEALAFMPEHTMSSEELELVRHGAPVPANGTPAEARLVRLTDAGKLVAVAERRDDMLKPVTVVGQAL